MAFELVGKPQTRKLTKALAKQWYSMEPAPNDRIESPTRLERIGRWVARGEFKPPQWASCMCRETGMIYRVNGKHTSKYISENGETSQEWVTIEEWICDTLLDVAAIYSMYDSKDSARRQCDINWAHAGVVGELSDVPKRLINKIVTGIAFANWETQMHNHDSIDRANLVVENQQFALWVSRLVAEGAHRPLTRGPVIAAMFRTYQKCQKGATEFWTLVRDESGDKPSLPDRKLAKFLSTTAVGTGRGGAIGMRRDSQRAFYVKCLHAWNAWREGGTTDLKYHEGVKTPAVK